MLKTVLDNLDGVDDAVKAFYAEKDGKFVLQIDGIDAHPEVANLKSAYERVKVKEGEARTALTQAKADLDAATKGKPDEAALIAERQGYETKITDLTSQLTAAQGKLTGVTRDQALTSALTAAGITDAGLLAGAAAIHRERIKLGEDGSASVETPMGPKPLSDFIKGWAASEGKAFVTPAEGGGAKGSQSQNGGKVAGNLGGTREERVAALKAKFPDLQ